MNRFIGRRRELQDLNNVLTQRGAQFILVYGRRRVGKTTLLLQWADRAVVLSSIGWRRATRPPKFAPAL